MNNLEHRHASLISLVETVQALIIPDPEIDPLILEKLYKDKYNKN
nr:hypothetical protein [uncultured Desulfobacter sp.]